MTRTVRIAGQAPRDWSESTRAELASVGESARQRLHLPLVIAHHPTFLVPYMTWAKAVALDGVLEHRDNALLALRTALLCDSEFEWGVHAESAVVRAGLTTDDVARVAEGPGALGWSRRDTALLRAADELHRGHAISDELWLTLSEYFTDVAIMELTFVCGHYTMLSMVANTVGVEPEEHWMALPTTLPGGGR